jgi:hypothetical protein
MPKTVRETVASFVSAGKAISAGQWGFPALMGFSPSYPPLRDDLRFFMPHLYTICG